MNAIEYSASEIRKILQLLFPQRRLVLSQFTFFNHCGVARPTGETFRRGRRCYRLTDILSIATVLALKEEGIPLKNIELVPAMIQEKAELIFAKGPSCRLSGWGNAIQLILPGEQLANDVIDGFLTNAESQNLFWSYDVGMLAVQLELAASGKLQEAQTIGVIENAA